MGTPQTIRTVYLTLVASVLSVLVLGCGGPQLQSSTPSRQELVVECAFIDLRVPDLLGHPLTLCVVDRIGIGQGCQGGWMLGPRSRPYGSFDPPETNQPPEPAERASLGIWLQRKNEEQFRMVADWTTENISANGTVEAETRHEAEGILPGVRGASLILLLPDKEKPVFAVVCWIRSEPKQRR